MNGQQTTLQTPVTAAGGPARDRLERRLGVGARARCRPRGPSFNRCTHLGPAILSPARPVVQSLSANAPGALLRPPAAPSLITTQCVTACREGAPGHVSRQVQPAGPATVRLP